MTGLEAIKSVLVGRQLLSVGKKKFRNARITDVAYKGYEDDRFGDSVTLILTLSCQDKIGRMSIRDISCDMEDELNLEYVHKTHWEI